ncbi:MAG: hypothetical protein IH988_07595, partial [Planctomycetes bacterium]|nr:hypothetical protein [Planctomycetota bacterium]
GEGEADRRIEGHLSHLADLDRDGMVLDPSDHPTPHRAPAIKQAHSGTGCQPARSGGVAALLRGKHHLAAPQVWTIEAGIAHAPIMTLRRPWTT